MAEVTIATIPVDITNIQAGQNFSHITFAVLDPASTEGAGLAGIGDEELAIDVANSIASQLTLGPASLVFQQP
jgi:hypothetical protein